MRLLDTALLLAGRHSSRARGALAYRLLATVLAASRR